LSVKKKKETYQNHRDIQRERILDTAERLFIQEGIDNISISAIADAARIARRTLYQYFPDKQEISWAIYEKIVEKWSGVFSHPLEKEGNGYQQLERLVLLLASQWMEHPEDSRFIVEHNTLYARESNVDRIGQVNEQASLATNDLFTKLIRQGIADGSIRVDVESYRLTVAILNMVNCVNSRFALLSENITQEYNLPAPEIHQDICRIFLRGIQARPS